MIIVSQLLQVALLHQIPQLDRIRGWGLSIGGSYLIFVTGPRARPVEKKSAMWRNFKFLYMKHIEKAKISPHLDKFQTSSRDR